MSIISDKIYPIVIDIPDKFKVTLRGRITQLTGFSGAGKTYFCNVLKLILQDIKNNDSTYPDYFKDIITYNVMSNFCGIEDLKKHSNKLIVLDRADDLADNVVKYIRGDRNNCYIIIARNCLDLGISPNYVCTFKMIDGVVKSDYMFSEKGWF